jgi:hypothetical protein
MCYWEILIVVFARLCYIQHLVQQPRLFDRRLFPICAPGGVSREPLRNRIHSYRDCDDVRLSGFDGPFRVNVFDARLRLNT